MAQFPSSSERVSNSLAGALQQLDAVGQKGFEGFIADLLRAETGLLFRVSRSGDQKGRDLDSDRAEPWLVAVECKRYRYTTNLDERELRSEIEIAVSADPHLDLWLLATSRDVDANLDRNLQTIAAERGLDCAVLSCGSVDAPGSLDVLCAGHAEPSLHFIGEHSKAPIADVEAFLCNVQAHPNSAAIRNKVRRSLSAASVGLVTFRTGLNGRLTAAMADVDKSRVRFRSPLHVGAPAQAFPSVVRQGVNTALNNFWTTAQASTSSALCVVHGEEGDGKSWSVAAWVYELARQPDAPAVFWFRAGEVTGQAILDELAAHASRHIDIGRDVDYRKKLARWLGVARGRTALVILDGINERHDQQLWANVLTDLLGTVGASVAVITTCRTQTWNTTYKARISFPSTLVHVGPFNETEFTYAVAGLDPEARIRLSELGGLTRRPRYLSLAIRHLKAIGSARELTVPRLYYEDWKSRLYQKLDLPLDSDKFEALLRQLAQKARSGLVGLSERQVADEMPTTVNPSNALEELATGGVLRERPDGRYLVEEPYFIVGMSLLLLDAVEAETGDVAARAENIAQWLGDTSSWPLSAKICESSAWRALLEGGSDPTAAVALLLAWARSQNIDQASFDSMSRLASVHPDIFCQFCESLWADEGVDHAIESAILTGLVRVADEPGKREILARWFKRWLGHVHVHGESTQPLDSPAAQRRLERIRALLPTDGSKAGTADDFVRITGVGNQRLLRLARLALAVVSFASRRFYWEALVTGFVADAFMGGHRADVMAWLIVSSREPLTDLALDAANRLKDLDMEAAVIAAHLILRSVADPSLIERSSELEERVRDSRGPTPVIDRVFRKPSREDLPAYLADRQVPFHFRLGRAKEAVTDDSVGFPQDFVDDLLQVARSFDATSRRRFLSQSEHDLNWENVEPLLWRLAPDVWAEKLRDFARDAQNRDETALRYLAFAVVEFQPLLGQDELASIRAAWERTLALPEPRNMDTMACEAFLLEALLPTLELTEQVELLLRRGKSLDPVRMAPLFRPLASPDDEFWLASHAAGSDEALTTVLWFASAQQSLSEDVWLPLIERALSGAGTAARGLALELLSRFPSQRIREVLQRQIWHVKPDDCALERHFGTLLVVQYADGAPREILSRCDPEACGELLGRVSRLDMPDLVQAYTAILLDTLERLIDSAAVLPTHPPMSVSSPDPSHAPWVRASVNWAYIDNSISMRSEMSTWGGLAPMGSAGEAFASAGRDNIAELQEALRRSFDQAAADGNWLFGASWSDATIGLMLARDRGFLDRLTSLFDRARTHRRMGFAAPLVEMVARYLITRADRRGWMLRKQIEGVDSGQSYVNAQTEMLIVDETIFAAAPSPESEEEWLKRLDRVRTDRDLFRICSSLQAGGNGEWLRSRAAVELTSDATYYRTRALLLYGASASDDEEFERAIATVRAEESAAVSAVGQARLHRQRLKHMKHWLDSGLAATDVLGRMTAAKLFLACVDVRAWSLLAITRQACIAARPQAYDAFIGLVTDEAIKRAVKKNEEAMAKQLLGHRVCDHDAAPWLDA